MTKEKLFELLKNYDFTRVGYGSFQKFKEHIEAIPDALFNEWYGLKEGDVIWCKPGNSWGHSEEHVQAVFRGHGGWHVPGDGIVANVSPVASPFTCSPVYNSHTGLHTFIGQFNGLAQNTEESDPGLSE